MKKFGIVSIIVLVIILAVIGIVLLFRKYIRGNIMDGPGMINETFNLKKIMKMDVQNGTLLSIRYSSSGDMNGNTDSTELKRQNDGEYVIQTKYAQWYSEPLECKVYSVSEDDVKELIEMIDKYNFTQWSKLDSEDLFILDGPQTSISFIYNNKEVGGSSYESYGFSLDRIYPDEANDIIREFKQKLFSLINEENLIKEYKEER